MSKFLGGAAAAGGGLGMEFEISFHILMQGGEDVGRVDHGAVSMIPASLTDHG